MHKKFIDHHKHKKAATTAAMLAAMESNIVAIIAVTEDGKIPEIIPRKATTISWTGITSVMDG
eukprot:4324001-Ditylum_brightwellii.AAC.1